jgi:hypothetical protein
VWAAGSAGAKRSAPVHQDIGFAFLIRWTTDERVSAYSALTAAVCFTVAQWWKPPHVLATREHAQASSHRVDSSTPMGAALVFADVLMRRTFAGFGDGQTSDRHGCHPGVAGLCARCPRDTSLKRLVPAWGFLLGREHPSQGDRCSMTTHVEMSEQSARPRDIMGRSEPTPPGSDVLGGPDPHRPAPTSWVTAFRCGRGRCKPVGWLTHEARGNALPQRRNKDGVGSSPLWAGTGYRNATAEPLRAIVDRLPAAT